MRLSDLGTIITGKTPTTKNEKFWNGRVPFVTPGDIQGTKHIFKTARYVTDEGMYAVKGSILPKDAICVSCIGNIGYVGVTTKRCISNQQINSIVVSEDHNHDYVYYLIKSLWPFFKHYEGQSTTLSIMNKTQFSQIEVPDFTRFQEDRIAETLCALDEKIEQNNAINDNLLQQAMALFGQTFIDNPPSGESRPLYDFADYINGAAFKQDDYSASGLPIIKIAELKNGITDSTQFFAGDKGEKYLIHDKDILFSWSGNPDTSIDIFIWASGDAILNQHTFNVKSKEGFRWFMYLMLKYFKPQFTQIASNKQTTGLGHVTAADLKRLSFIYNKDEIASFEEIVKPSMEMIFSNMLENRSLIALRDSLLPRLMTGEIDVSGVPL